jgi:hypothetical protein
MVDNFLELKSIAEDWAEKVYHNICLALEDPSVALEGDDLRIYQELKAWGWFELCPISDDNAEPITRMYLAMNKYGKLKWAADHPPKPKPSKWDIVAGTNKGRKGRH